MPRFLHVANGSSTTRTIEAAGIPGRLLLWADPLYEGPVPTGLPDEELLQIRAQHLSEQAGITREQVRRDLEHWRAAILDEESYDEVVLWYEHDLFDQLNLVQVLSWMNERLRMKRPVTLVSVASFDGRSDFKGLGQLTPEELRSLFDTRRPVTERQWRLADTAWDAFREATPEALDLLRQQDSVALPYLAPSVTRFLQEYPWVRDGLSRSERRLLQLAANGSTPLSAAFGRMHEDERWYYITDLSLAALAEAMSRSSPPLLALTPAQAPHSRLLTGSVVLTQAGLDVLEGRLDRVARCGIDRWLGGVHLDGRANVWRWNDERQRITRA